MFARALKLACAASMIVVLAACDGAGLTGPEEDAGAPLNRTACMAGGDVAIAAGCPSVEEEETSGGGVVPVGADIDDCGPTFGASLSKQKRC